MRSLLLATAWVLATTHNSGVVFAEDRDAWRYTEKDLEVTITRQSNTEWIAERSDGRSPVYDEIESNDDHIVLQNRQTKLFVRLFADHAEWRRPKDADWTRWVRGSWTPRPVGKTPAVETRPYRVKLAYFVPRDRRPTKDYARKIPLVMAMVSGLYEADLRAKGFQTEGVAYEAENESPLVHLVRGEREAAHYSNAPQYNANEQWKRLLPEIKAALGDLQKQVVVVFAETYDSGPAEVLWPGVIARGAYYSAEGGLAVFSAHLLQDELCATSLDAQLKLLFDETPVPGRKAWGNRTNSPRGQFVEDGLGAVTHELGHAFGLPHDRRRDTVDIMGNGFRNLRRNYAPGTGPKAEFSLENARLLMSSRYLAADLNVRDNTPARVQLIQTSNAAGTVGVTVKATDDHGLRAIVFFDRSAGSVLSGKELSGKSRELRERFPAHDPKHGPLDLQVIVTDVGGNQTRVALKGPPSVD